MLLSLHVLGETKSNFHKQSMCSGCSGVPRIHMGISPAWIHQENEAMWLQERSCLDVTEKGSGQDRVNPLVDSHLRLPPNPSISRAGGPARAISPGWACQPWTLSLVQSQTPTQRQYKYKSWAELQTSPRRAMTLPGTITTYVPLIYRPKGPYGWKEHSDQPSLLGKGMRCGCSGASGKFLSLSENQLYCLHLTKKQASVHPHTWCFWFPHQQIRLWILALMLNGCVTLGNALSLSEPWLSYHKMGIINGNNKNLTHVVGAGLSRGNAADSSVLSSPLIINMFLCFPIESHYWCNFPGLGIPALLSFLNPISDYENSL